MTRFSTLRTLAFGASVALTAGACADAPTQPESLKAPSISAAVVSTGQLDFSHELGDIHSRFLPTFDDQQAAAQLQAEMDVITERLAAGDVEAVRTALGRARALLTPGVAHRSDLYALDRTFAVLESYLQ